jgi:hypothetical protein
MVCIGMKVSICLTHEPTGGNGKNTPRHGADHENLLEVTAKIRHGMALIMRTYWR